MLASVAALSGAAHAGEVMAPPVEPSAGAEFLAKGNDTVSVRFAGRTEFEYSTAESDDGFSFRRLRLGAKAELGSGFTSELITDFAKDAGRRGYSANDTEIRKAIVSYKFSDIFAISAGRDKVVFGYEETSSSATGVFLERSFINNSIKDSLSSGVQNGVTVSSDWGSGFSSAVSIVDGTSGFDGTVAKDELSYFARLQWANDSFTVGADYGDSGSSDGFTAYANYSIDGFNVLGEYFDVDTATSSSDGFAVRASYRFDNFEPVVRYSDFSNLGDDGDEIYVGVNYYAAPGVTLLTGYSKVDQDVAGEDESFTARLRVLW